MSQPLKGLKVLDFSTLLPGPYATQLLADMGAKVLRIEAPKRPDLLKIMPPNVGKVSAAHATLNRNKDCIALDLKHESAKEIIVKLLEEYDVIIEQFRPGVMKRLGLDYESLKEIQPKLIYCSITGYGQTGPFKDRAGHDINYLALSGLASFSGRKETGPVLSGTQIADVAGGSHHAVIAMLAAVIERGTTGVGQYLDISMADASLALTTMFGANALASGRSPALGSEMLNGGIFYDYYETSDGRYMSIGGLEPNFAAGTLQLLGLTDMMAKAADLRPESQVELRNAVAAKIKAESFEYWSKAFGEIDVCAEPVLSLNEATEHPQFIERNMIGLAVDADGNEIKQLNTALPFKPETSHVAGKVLGADTVSVLSGMGYTESEIAELKTSGVIK